MHGVCVCVEHGKELFKWTFQTFRHPNVLKMAVFGVVVMCRWHIKIVFIMWLRHFLFIAFYRFGVVSSTRTLSHPIDVMYFLMASSFASQSSRRHKFFRRTRDKVSSKGFRAVNKILFNYSTEKFICFLVNESQTSDKRVACWRNSFYTCELIKKISKEIQICSSAYTTTWVWSRETEINLFCVCSCVKSFAMD